VLLPAVVRWLGLAQTQADEHLREHEAELVARWDALKVTEGRLDALAANAAVSPEVLAALRAHHDYRVRRLPKTITDGIENAATTAELRGGLIAAERDYIFRLLQDGKITDESRRRIERELDLEEAIIANKKAGSQPL
jgi:hypothetical protein